MHSLLAATTIPSPSSPLPLSTCCRSVPAPSSHPIRPITAKQSLRLAQQQQINANPAAQFSAPPLSLYALLTNGCPTATGWGWTDPSTTSGFPILLAAMRLRTAGRFFKSFGRVVKGLRDPPFPLSRFGRPSQSGDWRARGSSRVSCIRFDARACGDVSFALPRPRS